MSTFEAVVLGLIQGLTEFLPVSSSGHLVIAHSLFNNINEPGLLFDTLLHFATLCAVIIFFRKKITKLILSFFGILLPSQKISYYKNKNYIWGIVIASIPTALIGLSLKSPVETLFRSTSYVGYALIATSLLLLASDKVKNNNSEIGIVSSFIIGIIQGLAVIPGISRSGSTIAVSLFLGIKREQAAEFSFLVSLPAIMGATLLQVKDIQSFDMTMLPVYLTGMATAFISGLISIGIMMKIVKFAKLKFFALYCLIVGIISIVWL